MVLHKIPEKKVCAICKEIKLSDEYYRDNSRVDGLKFACIKCTKSYQPKTSKLDFSEVSKTCVGCKRALPARNFSYRQKSEDHLSKKCRTCCQHKQGVPTVEEAEIFEKDMAGIYVNVISELIVRYNETYDVVVEKHRGEFEEKVHKMMLRQGLLGKWKLPVWVHQDSIN